MLMPTEGAIGNHDGCNHVRIFFDDRSWGDKDRDFGTPQLAEVFRLCAAMEYGTQPLDARRLLERIFEELNIGETSAVARAYRAAGNRSLSVADVVTINGARFRCDRFGWSVSRAGRWETF